MQKLHWNLGQMSYIEMKKALGTMKIPENTFIHWSGHDWRTGTSWGYIHPEEKARANCWWDAQSTYIGANDNLMLDILYNPNEEPNRDLPPAEWELQPTLKADYGVGKVESVQQFGLGTFEIKACLPQCDYLWPAFWLVNPTPGELCKPEIDIFEGYSKVSRYAEKFMCLQSGWNIQSCIHTPKELDLPPTPAESVGIYLVKTPDTEFNVYTLKWERNKLTFLINQFIVREITDPAIMDYLYYSGNGKMRVIINTHVDGNHYKKFSIDNYVSPFVIQYFKYQQND